MSQDFNFWFTKKLAALSNESERKTILLEIKPAVTNLEKNILQQVASNVSLSPVFDCLNTSDAEQIELATTVIRAVLKQLNGVQQLEMYGNLLLRALGHPSTEVKRTVLRLLAKRTDPESLSYLSVKQPQLLIEATQCLASSERSVAQGAIKMLTRMGSTFQGLSLLYSPQILATLKTVMLKDDTARFRVYEIVVEVAEKSVEGLQASQASELLPSLVSELKSTDTLIQLNVLEILKSLAACSHGLTYLQESGVIQYLVDRIMVLDKEPLSFVLLPGLIEFFGNLFKLEPKHFYENYPQVLDLLFQSIDTPDPVLIGVIVTTVGRIGSTNNGKRVLNKYPDKMQLFFKRASELLAVKNETTITVISSVSELIKLVEHDITLSEVTKLWFNSLGSNALDVVFQIAKLPFVELRLAALLFLKTIAEQPWGTEKVCSFAGMIEYLMDRSTEFNKECKNAKFDIASAIVNSPIVSRLVPAHLLIRLKTHVNEGPFYVPTQPEMAIEGAS